MDEPTEDKIAAVLREQGARYVLDAQSRPVAVLLTLEEQGHYRDLLDDEENSLDAELEARLRLAADFEAGAAGPSARTTLRDYLLRSDRQRPPADVRRTCTWCVARELEGHRRAP